MNNTDLPKNDNDKFTADSIFSEQIYAKTKSQIDTSLKNFLYLSQKRVDRKLLALLPNNLPLELHESVNYVLNVKAKRFRPALVYAGALSMGCYDYKNLDNIAAAVEYIHTYSLIHDDLPCMDDDDFRRGQQSCHKKFNEATAVLTGDFLQSLAFETVASIKWHSNEKLSKAIRILASHAKDMVSGQVLDISFEDKMSKISYKEIENMYALKTSKLISASLCLGALYAKNTKDVHIEGLKEYGHYLGIIFQIRDDLLEETSSFEEIGKSTNSDEKNNKSTYITGLSENDRKKQLDLYYQKATGALEKVKIKSEILYLLAKFALNRYN